MQAPTDQQISRPGSMPFLFLFPNTPSPENDWEKYQEKVKLYKV